MKNLFFSAIALTTAALTFTPVVNAAEISSPSIQQSRLEFLENQSKTENIQKTRLEFLDSQSKTIENLHRTRLEERARRNKNNFHKIRLDHLNSQTKAVENVQETRLEFLDSQSKAIENLHRTRLEERARRNKSNLG